MQNSPPSSSKFPSPERSPERPTPAKNKRPHESVDYVQHRAPKLKTKIDRQQDLDKKLGALRETQKSPSVDPIIVPPRRQSFSNSLVHVEKIPLRATFNAELVERTTETDRNNEKFTAYTLQILQTTPQLLRWKVQRRYRDFVDFRLKLRRVGFNQVGRLPPKTWTKTNFDDIFLTKRQEALAAWLRDVVTLYNQEADNGSAVIIMNVSANRDKAGGGSEESKFVKLTRVIRVFLVDIDAAQTDGRRVSSSSQGSASPASNPSGTPQRLMKSAPLDDLRSPSRSSTPIAAVNLSNFELLKVLGKGSYGKVILVRKKSGHDAGALYAMKVLKKEHVMKKKQVAHTKTERSVLGTIRHPFIVRLHYAFQTGEKLHFVLDYCSGGELFFHLQKHGRFPPKLALFYTAELALALGELHSHGIVYRDMKPENILLDELGHVQLADFGLSKEGIKSGEKGTRSFCGTPEYLAPEVLERLGHGFAVDWWALGALLYEMITGLPPWYSRDRQKMFAAIRSAPLQFPGYVVGDLKTLISEFLVREPRARLGGKGNDVNEIKEHSIFRFVNWEALFRKETKPPWKPPAPGGSFKNSYDISNFESTFTNLPVQSLGSSFPSELGRVEDASLGRAVRGESCTNGAFEGFTFVDESVLLEENFRDRLTVNDSDDM